MKCEYVNENTIKMQDCSTEFVNVLRRYCMNYIPILAPEYLDILENETAFFDEYISHRISVIPFKNSENSEGMMYLNVSNDTDEFITIYSGDLKGDYEVVYDNIPILVLTPGDKISIEVYFGVGTGKEHAKYKPCYAKFYEDNDGIYLKIEPYGHMLSNDIFENTLDVVDNELKELYEFVSS